MIHPPPTVVKSEKSVTCENLQNHNAPYLYHSSGFVKKLFKKFGQNRLEYHQRNEKNGLVYRL